MTKPLNLAVILNGPPNSGKDTLADALEPYGFEKQMFKTALYEQTAYYLQMDLEKFKKQATDRITKEEKTLTHPTQGIEFSPREAMIHVSEHMIKPHCGKDFFGMAAAQRCMDHKVQLAIFSDGTDAQVEATGILNLDADNGGNVNLKDGGTLYGTFQKENDDFRIISNVSDGAMRFRGNDGGSYIDALVLDMSINGAATFSDTVSFKFLNNTFLLFFI